MTNAAPTLTVDPLWTRARATFARALAAIGAIGAIAALRTLTPDVRRRIVAWLAPLEHIVRKLLLAEATALHRAARENARRALRIEVVPLRGMALHHRPKVGTASLRARHGAGIAESCEPEGSRSNAPTDRANTDPETWRATFSLAPPRDPLAIADSRAPRIRALWDDARPPAPPPPPPPRARRIVSAEAPFRLARRLEALRRVLENPLPHAERLARLLARAVRRFPEIVRRYLFAPARANGYDKADPRLSVDAYAAALPAPHVITDSS
jgi:hypothetical protein